jgi:hypothetical protein
MICTNEQMDAAIDRWRKTPNAEQLYADLADDAEFKGALEAAAIRAMKSGDPYARFWEVDAAGWRPDQFTAKVDPARPVTTDFRERLATEQNDAAERRRLGLPIRSPKRMQFVIPYID